MDSIAKAHLLLVAKITTILVLKTAGINTGNAGIAATNIEERMRNNPTQVFLKGAIRAPLVEELLFRLLPYSVFGNSWTVGTLSSFVFAHVHNKTSKGFDIKTVPLPQFLGGLFFWYLMDKRGISHTILAHSSTNTTLLTMLWLAANYGPAD